MILSHFNDFVCKSNVFSYKNEIVNVSQSFALLNVKKTFFETSLNKNYLKYKTFPTDHLFHKKKMCLVDHVSLEKKKRIIFRK